MNIDEMTPEEKSVALAKLCEWIRPAGDEFKPGVWVIDIPDSLLYRNYYWRSEPFGIDINFYDPANMSLAWRVGVWAGDNLPNQSVTALNDFWMRKDTYPYKVFMWYEPEAQRLWLDKILQLAIDAGLTLQEQATQ